MKRFVSAAATLLLFAGTVVAQDRQAKADFTPVSGSDVTGFAQITQLPHGGSLLRIVVRGLDTNASYASFYYEDPGCEGPPDLLGNFTAMPNGTGEAHARIEENIDKVGSVAVRLGPGHGALLARAKLH